MELKNFRKEGAFYLDIRPSAGNGDLLFNTFWNHIERDDKSPWVKYSFVRCFDCLHLGQRWPDDMAEHITTTNHTQTKMTRDPWIAAYACAVHLKMYYFIETFKPPIKLYTPEVWAWRRALLHKPNIFKFWRWITPVRKKQADYVHELQRLMDQAYEKVKYQYYNSNHG